MAHWHEGQTDAGDRCFIREDGKYRLRWEDNKQVWVLGQRMVGYGGEIVYMRIVEFDAPFIVDTPEEGAEWADSYDPPNKDMF